MGLSFERPLLLILLPFLIFGTIYSSKLLKRFHKNKKKLIILLRSIVFSFLILAMVGTSISWNLETVATLFLIDASDSTLTNRNDMEAFIKEAYKLKGRKDQVGVISFGDNAQVESFIGKDNVFNKIEGKINGNYTNIENAITTALSLFQSNNNKRIVLLSDGEENIGSTAKIASSLQEQGIDFKYKKVDKVMGEEAQVESVEVPQKLSLDEEFNVVVTINSTTDQKASITLFKDKAKVTEQMVEFQKGVNKFVFRDKAVNGGFMSYKVLVTPEKDTEVKNNEASCFTDVVAKPKILVLQDTEGEADELVKMLKASAVKYTLLYAKAAPNTIQAMNSYKSIITCNVMVDNLPDGFKNSLESYVKDFGGGFIATGGDNSFALGGYAKTPLEKVLPVYMDMRGKKETPKMAMVLIIDKSGSMSEGVAGISKVDMAKEAAIRSLDSLRVNKDEIGVLTLDGSFSWVVKEQVIKDPKAIEEDIGTIRADGGTSIIPALEEADNALKESDAKIKHIILLTDGMGEGTGYEQVLSNFNKNSITVSTVAIGLDSDKQLLSSLALSCGGRFYITDEYTNIPSIFTKETFMAARTYLNNRKFTPIINSNHVILKGVAEGGLPALFGYIGASQKETGRMLLRSDEDDPILTVWQYGLGKAVAWNSDVSGKWNANYISWDKNLKLWQNIINFTVENYNNENTTLEITQQDGKGIMTLRNKNNDNELNTIATVIAPSGESSEIKLNPTAPGQYTGTIDLKENGVYMVNGKQDRNGEVINSIKAGYTVQYSPEYKMNNSGNLDKLVTAMGGEIIKDPKEVFTSDINHKRGQRDLTPLLLALFLMLFMLDIAVRRLNISPHKIQIVRECIYSKANSFKVRVLGKKKNYNVSGHNVTKRTVSSYETLDASCEDDSEIEIVKEMVEDAEVAKNGNTLDTSQLLKKKRFK